MRKSLVLTGSLSEKRFPASWGSGNQETDVYATPVDMARQNPQAGQKAGFDFFGGSL